jgi:hypothetical protein
MANNKYGVDWSTPILSGFSAGFDLAQASKQRKDKADWDTFLTGISLMKTGEQLPKGMADFMSNYMKRKHDTDVDFNTYKAKIKNDTLPITIDEAQNILNNARRVYNGELFLGDEKSLMNYINENSKDDGTFKIGKKDLEGAIDTYYTNLLNTQATREKNIEAGKKEVRVFKNTIKKKELTKLVDGFTQLQTAKDSLSELDTLLKTAYIAPEIQKGDILGGLTTRVSGFGKKILGKIGAESDVESYDKLRQSMSGIFSKGVFRETGVLTDQDIKRAMGSIPEIGDTKKEILNKQKTLNNIINKAESNFKNRYYRITGEKYTGKPLEFNSLEYQLDNVDFDDLDNSNNENENMGFENLDLSFMGE